MAGLRTLFRRRRTVMPKRFEPLAIFNAEVSRGIPHTPETIMRMAELQAEFNDWILTRKEAL